MTALDSTPPVSVPTMFSSSAPSLETGPDTPAAVKMTESEVNTLLLYLRKARSHAARIQENSPAGSYLETVLARTIAGIEQEISQLKYVLSKRDLPPHKSARMRPAI